MWGRIWVGIFVGCSLASGASLASPGADSGTSGGAAFRVLDKPAFTATPSELLALGKAAPAGDWPMVILRDQRDVSYDDKARATVRSRRVYVVQTQYDPDDEDAVHAAWHPSYQNKPVIRARVITPAGNVVELDPTLITEEPTQRPANVVSDHRFLGAPLPTLQVGAVVEQEIVTTDREPLPTGSVDMTQIGSFVPTSSTMISYSAPAAAKVHHAERKLPAGTRVRHQVTNGRETWTYEISALPARTHDELNTAADVDMSSCVGVGTAASWEAVARAYRKLLDQRIAEGPYDLPAELPRTASIEAVNAIVAWVHHQVRHTGSAFTEAIRTPSPPAETVKQATGDGNDKATLLVALLRQAGLRADVALIESAWGHRLDPDLPGMGAFEHATVRVRIGARDLWIDPANDLARPGQLPGRDQGRRALVIADDTKGLSMMPMATSADNLIRDIRTFVASEYGASQLTQVVRYSGVFEAEQRNQFRGPRTDLLKRSFSSQIDAMFGGTLEQVTSSDPRELTNPFEITFTVKDAHRVGTDREQIDIFLYPHDTLEHLPWIVTEKPDNPRNNDFVWPRPLVYEVENRIIVPAGFTLPAAAPERIRRIGTATFTERQRIDGQTLIVTFRFDSGKLRITPPELATLQASVQELRDETVHLKIAQTAFALGDAGKPREAIAECQRLIALHPTEAFHHSQLSLVLLRAGAGEAARREARKAIALAPADVDTLVVLGWTLSFDTLGRQYTYDWDRAGAIAALQQARKLDPKHLGAVVTLAQALQRDSSGRAYEGSADLPGAVDAWRAALALEKTDEHALALAQVLVMSGQFAEAEKVARSATESEDRDKWIVAAIAGNGGAAPAIKAAGDLRSGASRHQLLTTATWTMMLLQRYDVARELLAERGVLARAPQAATTMFKKMKQYPDIKQGTADPRAAVFDVLAAMSDPLRKTPVFWDAELEREFRGLMARFIPATLRTSTTTRWFGDVVQSLSSVEIEGDAGVWRATVENDGKRFQLYLVLDRGIAKLIGATDMLPAVGRYILRDRDAKAEARARKLLDWIRADSDKAISFDLLSFKKLWGQGIPPSHNAIMLAAAVLTGATDPDRVIAVGSQCASTLPDAELACHEMLFLAYRARQRWPEAVIHSEAILALRPDSLGARGQAHAWALSRAGRFDDAGHTLDEVLAKAPDHHGARVGRFEVAAILGSNAELTRHGDAMVNHPAAVAGDFNYVAWYRIGMGGDLSAALDLARKAVDEAPEAGAYVNTLAAIEAELGDLDRAIHDNWKAMRLRNLIEPTADDWYVAGRIYEQLGLAADATAAYKRVTRSKIDLLLSAYMLAERRLAAMGVAP